MRATLEYCTDKKRIRIGYTKVHKDREPREVWITVVAVEIGSCRQNQLLCYDESNHSIAPRAVDEDTLMEEILGTHLVKWRSLAKALWIKQFGKPEPISLNDVEMILAESSPDVPWSSKLTESSSPSGSSGTSGKRKNPENDKDINDARRERHNARQPSQTKQAEFVGIDLESIGSGYVIERWHDLSKTVSLQDICLTAVRLQIWVRAVSMPPLQLLQEIRATAQRMFAASIVVPPHFMYCDPKWIEWVCQVDKKESAT